MQTLNSIVFGWYPYLCLTVFLFGSLVRFDREQYSWKAGSSQLLRRKQLVAGSVLFHVGVLVIFFGHLGGLLTPIAVFDALGISHGFKQGLAIVAGGIAGVMCFIGLTLLVHRRLFDARIRKTSSFSDVAVLLMLYAQLILGLATIPALAVDMLEQMQRQRLAAVEQQAIALLQIVDLAGGDIRDQTIQRRAPARRHQLFAIQHHREPGRRGDQVFARIAEQRREHLECLHHAISTGLRALRGEPNRLTSLSPPEQPLPKVNPHEPRMS